MDAAKPEKQSLHARIYAVVRQIPAGKVASYGQIAKLVGGCTARMVGYAMAATPAGEDIPWQRVINAQGKISPHGAGFGSAVQRQKLEEEGLEFDSQGRIDWRRHGWPSPEPYIHHPAPEQRIRKKISH
ncbi:MAG TPA: MGMT family protein [Anaerolineaceae bacterium]|nr:MGMT family protein [Anaerolineaceae bacterium]